MIPEYVLYIVCTFDFVSPGCRVGQFSTFCEHEKHSMRVSKVVGNMEAKGNSYVDAIRNGRMDTALSSK